MQPKKTEPKKPSQNKDEKRKNQPPADSGKKSNLLRNVVFWSIIIIMGALLIGNFAGGDEKLESIAYPELKKAVDDGTVKKITEQGMDLTVTMKDEEKPSKKSRLLEARLPDAQLIDTTKVEYESVEVDKTAETLWSVASIVLPLLIIAGLFLFMMRGMQSQTNQSLGFGRSRAKLFAEDKKKVKFSEIAGNVEAKEDLFEVVDFLKDPKKYLGLGAKIPKGVLLVGPPGTGKTMLARAVAGEAGAPFFSISGSEFVEMFVGVGASRVRDLFEKAKKNAPCIIFIDEIDAVGRRRGSGMGGGHDEREQTLNQILVEMDGFETGQNVIVLAATNRADVLDPALLRPGRFDRRVNIVLPERRDREEILFVHFKDKPVDDTVDIPALAAKTPGSSGADLANIANEAAIIAARSGRKKINGNDVTEAFEKVAIGPERKSKIMNDRDKELTAYHEAGHAVVGHVLPDSDPVHKVTIIPRGATGGVTWFLPPEDRAFTSIVEFKDILARAMGGRLAEEVVYGRQNVTTGASSDLRHATQIAHDMVTEEGMGTKLRDRAFHSEEGGLMFDKMTRDRPYSDKTAEEIDREVNELLGEAVQRAREVIKANRKALDALAQALLERETIDEEEINQVLKGAKLPTSAKLY
ncbi:MAG: ATP-dependent zinc metalloprotease FtsH [Candidatus Nomurabacteria bacterium]|jgi:cell division protease FtsH|nr:ATP-dependent zinc metalloprotease FtsH [Candidatus Nomurabacteria bacterium]